MWFHRCDRCGRRRLLGWYYEVYGRIDAAHLAACEECWAEVLRGQDGGPLLGSTVWWWECQGCLVQTITDVAERELKKMKLVICKECSAKRGKTVCHAPGKCDDPTAHEVPAILKIREK